MTALRPRTWDEAVRLRAEHPQATVVAGGTALQPLFNTGTLRPRSVLSLGAVEVVPISQDPSGVRLDALITVHQALTNPLLARLFPDLELRWFAVPAVRRRATLVGNLLAPGGRRDLAVLLLLADARLHVRSPDGERELELTSSSLLETSLLEPDELVTATTVTVPDRLRHARAAIRAAVAPAAATVAMALTARKPRVVLSIAGRVGRVPAAEAAFSTGDVVTAVQDEARAWSGDQYAVLAAGVLARRCHQSLLDDEGDDRS